MENFDKEIHKAASGYFGINGAFLAGGAITSTFTGKPINDYDLYFKDQMSLVRAIDMAYQDNWFCLAQTERAITFSDNGTIVQLMTFGLFPTAQDIFNKYDFTCCMGAIDLETKEFFRHPNFLTDIAKRQLIFNYGTDFPLASALRVKKYKEKGFEIDSSEYLKILLAVIFKNPKNWDELANQIGGQYGEALKVSNDVEFNIENAIIKFTEKINTKTSELEFNVFEGPSNFMEALTKIYGKEEAETLEKKLEEENK